MSPWWLAGIAYAVVFTGVALRLDESQWPKWFPFFAGVPLLVGICGAFGWVSL